MPGRDPPTIEEINQDTRGVDVSRGGTVTPAQLPNAATRSPGSPAAQPPVAFTAPAAPTVNTKVTTDKNIRTYGVPDSIGQGYAALGATHYTPATVSAGPSVATVASRYAVDPTQVAAAVANTTRTNADIAAQQLLAQQQAQQLAQLQGAALGVAPSVALADNAALLQQAQAFRTSAANSARGSSEQRLAAQEAATAGNSALGMDNIATRQVLAAQEQEAARAQYAQQLGNVQQQDMSWLGAAYGIANQNAQRGFQTDVANQNARVSAGIANNNALVQGTGNDQAAVYNAQVANNGARTQAYRDATGRTQAGAAGELAAAQLGMTSAEQARQAQLAAQREQLARKQVGLDVKLAQQANQLAQDRADQQLYTAIAQGGVGLLTAGLL